MNGPAMATSFSQSPRILKGGLVLLDPATSSVPRAISLRCNAATLSCTLQVQVQVVPAGDGVRLAHWRAVDVNAT